MRLICPNCDAQYEVDDDAIPVEGRDVQCSNCGHTWFHGHGVAVDPPAEDRAAVDASPEGALPEPELDGAYTAAKDGTSAPDVSDVPGGDDDEDEDDYEDEDDGIGVTPEAVVTLASAAAPRRRELDVNVASLLREEAEREQLARRAERGALESQSDLGLEAMPAKADLGRVKDAPKDPFGDDIAAEKPRSGRALLPDIEQINSTLNASDDRADRLVSDVPEPDRADNRRGFRLGFGIVLLAGVLLWAVYVFTPQIVAQVPAAEPVLSALGSAIESIRLWLDQIMRQAIASINGPT